MVGLSASELQAETLFPGDTIEYYSMAFVAGDARGHRVSKVLRVDRKDDEFPIRVDSQEMLPLTIMLKRKQDRNGAEIPSSDAKWRKLRTFKLVDGEVEGETRADRLNAALKKSLADAMRSTKKILAKEKEEKANAGSKKLMSNFFVPLDCVADAGDTTSSQRSSLVKISTPERKKKRRKPLTPKENTDYSSGQSPENVHWKKNHSEDKSPRHKDNFTRPKQTFKYDKPEPRKRKRSDSAVTKAKQPDTTPRPNQSTISKYFSSESKPRRPKKKSVDLMKFVNRVEEKDEINSIEVKRLVEMEKKKQASINDIDAYIALDKKQQDVIDTVNHRAKSGSKGDSSRSDNPGKKTWNQQRSKYRESNPGSGPLKLWLTESKSRNGLEESSRGSPLKPQRSKQRMLNLVPDRQKSPKMDRKNIDFLMPNRSKEAKHSSHDVESASKQDNQLRKNRGSLGTVSARTPKMNLPGQWLSKSRR